MTFYSLMNGYLTIILKISFLSESNAVIPALNPKSYSIMILNAALKFQADFHQHLVVRRHKDGRKSAKLLRYCQPKIQLTSANVDLI